MKPALLTSLLLVAVSVAVGQPGPRAPERLAWEQAGALAAPRAYATAVTLVTGEILVVGGLDKDERDLRPDERSLVAGIADDGAAGRLRHRDTRRRPRARRGWPVRAGVGPGGELPLLRRRARPLVTRSGPSQPTGPAHAGEAAERRCAPHRRAARRLEHRGALRRAAGRLRVRRHARRAADGRRRRGAPGRSRHRDRWASRDCGTGLVRPKRAHGALGPRDQPLARGRPDLKRPGVRPAHQHRRRHLPAVWRGPRGAGPGACRTVRLALAG